MADRSLCRFSPRSAGLCLDACFLSHNKMLSQLSADDLIRFETDIANEFNAAKIPAPVHLYDGNEESIINVFNKVKAEDWVLCSWRSHYQCLLKGVPEAEVKREIRAGRSISLCFPDYRVLSSAIVGGEFSRLLSASPSQSNAREDPIRYFASWAK